MEPLSSAQHVGNNNVQVEVITSDGHPITAHPIRIEELLQQHNHTLDVGDGIALRLEELNAQQEYSDDGEDDGDDSSSASSSENEAGDEGEGSDKLTHGNAKTRAGAPPGTHATDDWYDVLDALRREQHDVERAAAAVERQRRTPQEGEGRLVTRNPNDAQSVATSLKRFSNLPSTTARSIAGDRSASPPAGASRHAVWASLAPPKDTQPHNYKVLRYVSYMSALDYRRFRPTALAFHAAAAYLNRKDRGQRLLVYGGLSVGAHRVEHELYEFSVLTGNWRRLEGRQLVPAGHYGHTMTVVESLDRLVVVGGIGPGGAAVTKEMKSVWAEDPQRAPRYQLLCPLVRQGGLLGGSSGSGVAAATQGRAAPLGIGAAARSASSPTTTIGFVSLLFDMNLSDLAWRAIQPAHPFPLAYHTATHFDKEIYVFGGLTAELRVSGQLLAINPETYAVRLVATASTVASSRSRHARSGSTTTTADDATATTASTTEDEAAGPGPRFLHTAVRYGPYMIIFGGYNTHNEPQSDCWAFDMVNERWERLRCRGEVAGRAGHECCVVGCRMIVTGGFECSLEEAGTTAAPASTVMELNLVPTTQGEYLWRGAVKLHPALPPLAFTRCAPCGEDHSFILFGGLTQLPRRGRSRSAGRRGGSSKRRIGEEDSGGDSEDLTDTRRHSSVDGVRHAEGTSKAEAAKVGHKGLLRRLTPFDDGLVFTFPVRPHSHHRAADEPVVNALGVEIDPNELPEHFKTFVRRQEDFVKKKDAAAADTIRKTTLEEQESMEPTLYLTDEEIELLLQRSEDCCVAFAQRYPMDSLPSNVPDREERVKLIEECVSESRQVRDVLKSMKGSAPGVTAVKSKSHRKRAGQKFEDYSAAKPFRRVVVVHLLDSINTHLARMHRLNKALRTVDWEAKAQFLEAVDDMQDSVHAVSRAINGVMRRYVQHRVESLMKGVDKHKEVMQLLTQVVEKNRHDKIWGVEEARDAQRHQAQRATQAAGTRARSQNRTRSTSVGQRGKDRANAAVAKASPSRAPPRSRSLGGGYHADESKAVVHVMEKEWSELLARTQAVEKCARQLQRYCRDGVTVSAAAGTASAPAASGGVPPPLSLPQPGVAPSDASAPPLPPPTQLVAPPSAGLPLPTPLPFQAPPTGALPTPSLPQPGTENQPPPSSPSVAAPEAGAARPRDIMIRHSNELRAKTAAVAEKVGVAAADFYATLTQRAKEEAAAPMSSSSSSSSSPSAQARGPAAAAPSSANVAVPQPNAPPAVATQQARDRSASTFSSGNSRSSSTSSSSSSEDAKAAPATQLPVVPPLGLPPPITSGLPLAINAAPSVPELAAAPTSENNADTVPALAGKRKKTAGVEATPTPAVSAGHALCLSSLRPLLAAKDALLAFKGQVALIRINNWDGNDLAGAPQDVKVGELYTRLEKLITSVAQSVTASFLTKAGARPPRARRGPSSVVSPAPTAASRAKRSAAPSSPSAHPAIAKTGAPASPALPHEVFAASSSLQVEGGGATASATVTVQGPACRQHHAGEVRRLQPLASATRDDDWWSVSPATCSGAANVAVAKAAAPLVPTDALLRDVRLEPTATSAPAATVTIQPVFSDALRVPNAAGAGVLGGAKVEPASCLEGRNTGTWSPTTAATAATWHLSHTSGNAGTAAGSITQPAVVSLGVAPTMVMPTPSHTTEGDRRRRSEKDSAQWSPRRPSIIEELTQLNPSALPAGASDGSRTDAATSGLSIGAGVAAREPITSITGGNFAVNTEYLYRAAPQTMPLTACRGTAEAGADCPDAFHVETAPHAWADVDDDYFYFGRPVENRIAPGDTVVSGPPYVSPAPMLALGQVGVSPSVGSVVPSQRMNAELITAARRPSTTRRSLSGHRAGAGYRTSTASQLQKTQTARVVRKEGTSAKNLYTPGELQLMQARERLRAKPQKSS